MNNPTKKSILLTVFILVLLALDQWLKMYIHNHFIVGETHQILPFFCLSYIENNGMIFGWQCFPKWVLSVLRIILCGLVAWYLHVQIHKRQARTSFLVTIALVIAGGLGNLIDCILYGKLFGYANWFYGKVIDMLYFPLLTNAHGEVIFFRPVFNLADSYITVAVIILLLFFRKDLDNSTRSTKEQADKQ